MPCPWGRGGMVSSQEERDVKATTGNHIQSFCQLSKSRCLRAQESRKDAWPRWCQELLCQASWCPDLQQQVPKYQCLGQEYLNQLSGLLQFMDLSALALLLLGYNCIIQAFLKQVHMQQSVFCNHRTLAGQQRALTDLTDTLVPSQCDI